MTFADIMGLEQTILSADIIKTANQVVDTMAKDTADKIIELNGGKPVSAVFVVGGGGKDCRIYTKGCRVSRNTEGTCGSPWTGSADNRGIYGG